MDFEKRNDAYSFEQREAERIGRFMRTFHSKTGIKMMCQKNEWVSGGTQRKSLGR